MKTIVKGLIQVDYTNKNILADAGVPVNTPTASEPQTYIDTDTGELYTYDGATWILVGSGGALLAANGVQIDIDTLKLGGDIDENTLLAIQTGVELKISDVDGKGIQYDAEYNANLTDLSLVPKKWVEDEEANIIGNAQGENFVTFTGVDYIANGDYTVKAAIEELSSGLSSFTEGSVLFADATGKIVEDNTGLFFNDALNNVGIGVIPTTDGENTLSLGIGAVPTAAGIDIATFYTKDYDATAGQASPYVLTEDLKTISLRRAQHRDIVIEFFPSLETVKYMDMYWSSTTLIKEFIFDTNKIDSLSVRFRKSSLGSAQPFSSAYPISYPLNNIEITNLNTAIDVEAGTGSVELQITANFDVAWTTQATIRLVTEAENIR